MFSTVVILLVTFAIVRWIIRSVMEPGLGGGGKVDERAVQRRAQAADSTAPARAPAPAPRTAAPATRTASRPRPTAPVRPQQRVARRHEEVDWDWHIELDVPQDSPRTEILAAVRRRLASARASGDTGGALRIARAAQAGLRNRQMGYWARRIGPRLMERR